MNAQRRISCLALSLIFMTGCISNGTAAKTEINPLPKPNFTKSTFRVQVRERETSQPVPNVVISRVDPIPNPNSFWSKLRYGDKVLVHTKLGTTDKLGFVTLSAKEREAMLELQFGDQILTVDCGNLFVSDWKPDKNGEKLANAISIFTDDELTIGVPQMRE